MFASPRRTKASGALSWKRSRLSQTLPHEIVSYDENSPFCVLKFPTLATGHAIQDGLHYCTELEAATIDTRISAFESRSILSKCIYEVSGQGRDHASLHADVKRRSQQSWDRFRHKSFKFSIDCYGSTRDVEQQIQIIDSFRYLDFKGKIKMKNPEVEFAVLEEWLPLGVVSPGGVDFEHTVDETAGTSMRRVFLARKIGDSSRWLREKHDLKKRPYISTTSMDAELALLTANMALASPGKIFLDPFVGTGGFMVAASELGALVLGSDIDGRSFRGKGTRAGQGCRCQPAEIRLDRSVRRLLHVRLDQYALPHRGHHRRLKRREVARRDSSAILRTACGKG